MPLGVKGGTMMTQERKEFLFAKEILELQPTTDTRYIPLRSGGKSFREYKDEYITVIGGVDTQSLYVEIRQPLTEANSNPIIYVDDKGECYRNHGERIYFIIYAEALLKKAEITPLYGHGAAKAEMIRSLVKV